MEKINIFLVSNMYPSKKNPSYGIFVKNFVDNIESRGALVSKKAVIKNKTSNKLEKIFIYIKFYYNILKKGSKKDYDVIYLHYVTHASIPLLFLKFFVDKPLIMNAHGSDIMIDSFFSKILRWFTKILAKKADMFVVPSQYFKEVVVNKFPIVEDKIFISPSSGINFDLFKSVNELKDKENLNLDNEYVIGYVSRLYDGKGWDIYLEALKLFKENNNDIKFKGLVIGDGPDKNEFLKTIKKLKLEDNIIYLGSKPQNQLPPLYSVMDIFVFPTKLKESLGLVGLEAMACRVPVIGSNIGGLKSYIKDEKNGLFFEMGNKNDLYDKIIYFYNKEEKEVMREKALETAQNYDSEVISLDLFKRINEEIIKK
ncbi:glycosyltransferase family 4 protein [Halanaerocella petrolearia]